MREIYSIDGQCCSTWTCLSFEGWTQAQRPGKDQMRHMQRASFEWLQIIFKNTGRWKTEIWLKWHMLCMPETEFDPYHLLTYSLSTEWRRAAWILLVVIPNLLSSAHPGGNRRWGRSNIELRKVLFPQVKKPAGYSWGSQGRAQCCPLLSEMPLSRNDVCTCQDWS